MGDRREEGESVSTQADHLEGCVSVLGEFLEETGALCAMIFDRGGERVAERGVAGSTDLTAIGALAAGAYASTEELARLIGEREFSVLFHQGEQDHLLVTLVDEGHLLLVVFDDRTTVGLVRMCAKAVAARLSALL
jgi:predicted regulator of Ras-like GTPase activity (Roadblock/LC7/MglB family)